ncbi:hypothetical protein XENTR_v10003720 [Xenopus tropicalis]|nr:hypothetical protein XENTR_v10003720 [Xenopus tropicalis]
MGNHTYCEAFHILAFSDTPVNHLLLFCIFFFIYWTAILGNLTLITLVSVDSRLHTPMYILLSNLSFLDICFITVTIPKATAILLSGYNDISFTHCFIQLCFYIFFGTTETIILSSMAYDRYVVICHPLHYKIIINGGTYALIVVGPWIMGCVNSLCLALLVSNLSFCGVHDIEAFFCNIKSLYKISCNSSGFQTVIYVDALIIGLFQFILTLMSYTKIIMVTLRIKSSSGRMKSFSTCSSHLTSLVIFYGTMLGMYIRPPSEHADDLDNVFSVLNSAIIPMLNPLVYSLRNQEVKSAMVKMMPFKNK